MLPRTAILNRLPAGKLIDILATLEDPPVTLTPAERRVVLACRSYLRMAEKVDPGHPVLEAFAGLLESRGIMTAQERADWTARG